MAREDENLRGQEVRLERSERTLRQQRPAGRATQWRVILYPAYRLSFTPACMAFPTPSLTFILSTKIVRHFPLTVNDSVTYSIAFFYICLKLFLRYLWLKLAFSAVRFNVHGINRSDMQHFVRNFSYSARLLITKCCEILRCLFWCSGRSINFSAENTRLKFF